MAAATALPEACRGVGAAAGVRGPSTGVLGYPGFGSEQVSLSLLGVNPRNLSVEEGKGPF